MAHHRFAASITAAALFVVMLLGISACVATPTALLGSTATLSE